MFPLPVDYLNRLIKELIGYRASLPSCLFYLRAGYVHLPEYGSCIIVPSLSHPHIACSLNIKLNPTPTLPALPSGWEGAKSNGLSDRPNLRPGVAL